MELSHRIENQICVIEVQGDVTGARLEETLNYIEPFLDTASIQGILLNLHNVTFITSAGIGWILFIFKTMQQRQAKFALCQVTPKILSTLKVTNVDQMISIYPTELEALHQL